MGSWKCLPLCRLRRTDHSRSPPWNCCHCEWNHLQSSVGRHQMLLVVCSYCRTKTLWDYLEGCCWLTLPCISCGLFWVLSVISSTFVPFVPFPVRRVLSVLCFLKSSVLPPCNPSKSSVQIGCVYLAKVRLVGTLSAITWSIPATYCWLNGGLWRRSFRCMW